MRTVKPTNLRIPILVIFLLFVPVKFISAFVRFAYNSSLVVLQQGIVSGEVMSHTTNFLLSPLSTAASPTVVTCFKFFKYSSDSIILLKTLPFPHYLLPWNVPETCYRCFCLLSLCKLIRKESPV